MGLLGDIYDIVIEPTIEDFKDTFLRSEGKVKATYTTTDRDAADQAIHYSDLIKKKEAGMENRQKFAGKKYITRGVAQDVPLELQHKMFEMIEALRRTGTELDYLQSFSLEVQLTEDGYIQVIRHSQEFPKYSKSLELKIEKPVSVKLFVISDEDKDGNEYCTMLRRDEY